MSNVYRITKKQLRLIALGAVFIVMIYSFWAWNQTKTVAGSPEQPRIIHMVTGEFKTTTKKGAEIEAYRWDPGTIVVKEGEAVELRIRGVNGEHHPFIIEGLNLKGEVHKGKETIVRFVAEKEGIYRIICLTHTDFAHNGPMIGYIVVD
jgi:heme/copper-type cytochrome/quinol oxidase subunit 2